MEYQHVSRSPNLKKKFEILLKKAKGQLISKGLVGVFIFPKKTRKQVNLKSMFFPFFFGRIRDTKNPFEINWPLNTSYGTDFLVFILFKFENYSKTIPNLIFLIFHWPSSSWQGNKRTWNCVFEGLRCEISCVCLHSFPQMRELSIAQFVYFWGKCVYMSMNEW